MKQNTSFKIACGYFLLICLLLGSIYYIYHQTTSLTRMSGNEQTLAERRKVTHQLVSRLFETENIGQAIHFGRWEAYRKYVQSMSDVQQTISALDTLFTDSSNVRTEVSSVRAGCSGTSKGALTPVKSLISPRRARAYKPFTSRCSQTSNGVDT